MEPIKVWWYEGDSRLYAEPGSDLGYIAFLLNPVVTLRADQILAADNMVEALLATGQLVLLG